MLVYERYTDNECYVVVCNFEYETDLKLDLDGELALSNYGERKISGTYKPFECAVYKI